MVKTLHLPLNDAVYAELTELKEKSGLAWDEYFYTLATGKALPRITREKKEKVSNASKAK